MRVLVVEDDEDFALLLRSIIEEAGHEYGGAAASVEEAVAQSTLLPPDVAMFDIGLRGPMIGIEGAQLLRRKFPACSLIFISGHSEPIVVQSTASLKPVAYLVKPVEPKQVQAALAASEADQRERAPSSARKDQT